MRRGIGKVIAIIIVVIVLVALAAGAGLYFFTDLFKSDRELFAKYAFGENSYDMIKFDSYDEYQQKLGNLNYSTEGSLKGEAQISEVGALNEIINNVEVAYSGETNNETKQNHNKIKLIFKNNDIVEIETMKDEDTYGIYCGEIINKYLSFENNNIKEFAENLGLDEEEIALLPDKFETVNYKEFCKIDDKTKKDIQTKTINFLKEKTKDENFSSEKNVEIDGTKMNAYTAKFSAEEVQILCIDYLKMIKDDDTFINLIMEKSKLLQTGNLTTKEEVQETIQMMIDSIEESEISEIEGQIEITLYVENGKVKVIRMETTENGETATAEIRTTSNSYNVKMFVEEEEIEISLIEETNYGSMGATRFIADIAVKSDMSNFGGKISYVFNLSGIEDAWQEQLEITATMEDEEIFKLTNELIRTVEDVEIDKLTEENAAKINDMDTEYLTQLISAITDRIGTVYEKKVELVTSLLSTTSFSNNTTDVSENQDLFTGDTEDL